MAVGRSLSRFEKVKYNIQWKLYKVKMIVYASFANQEWKHMKWYSKMLYVPVGAIFSSIMKLTIPPFAEDHWDRRFAMLFPIFGLSLIVSQFELYDDYLFLAISYPIALVLCLAIYCTTHRQIAPRCILVMVRSHCSSSPS